MYSIACANVNKIPLTRSRWSLKPTASGPEGRSYQKLNPKAAPGVDDVTWLEYGNGLESRIFDLHDRVHNGRYFVS